jgi:TIR domain
MSDIFISYAKADHALALKLSAFLESEGWSVWWDKSLAAADLYRDEIMKQLAAARAVITIWSPNSVRSDWVRAEAGRAKAEGKLIPVKTPDVAYGDIPLPFGEMHTENLEASQLIRAAVVAQLAKPAVEPSAWTLLAKGFKWELLTWWGIIGGALTLFTAVSATLKLADWARVLVEHWKEWTHGFWLWAFGWLGIHLLPEWAPVLSFLLFASLLTIGQAVTSNRIIKNQYFVDKYDSRYSFQLKSWRTWFCLILLIVSPTPLFVVFVLDQSSTTGVPWVEEHLSLLSVVFVEFLITPPVIIALFARHRLHAALSVVLMQIFYGIIVITQLMTIGHSTPFTPAAGVTSYVMVLVLPLILLSVAPAKAVSRRLIFLALGLLLLIALNELSKLGLDLTAPKHQG